MYPRDTVSSKQLDKVDDRSNRRIDLLKTKHNDLIFRVAELENAVRQIMREWAAQEGDEEE